METQWIVYVLRCGDGSLYTGITTDLAARLAAHNAGRGAKYTRSRLPVVLVYQEQVGDRSAALRRERAIKALRAREKWRLVEAAQGLTRPFRDYGLD
ncbi:GIY-YIG nuclease family protein [Thiobacter aerophilum]|uniref:GIY-YIG nuclease family protein n=1 Tax=Thiobacter aerophilum TaxID=3121275 RepID=A0ABV0EE31_9BURK